LNDEPSEQSRFNFLVALQFALIGALLSLSGAVGVRFAVAGSRVPEPGSRYNN